MTSDIWTPLTKKLAAYSELPDDAARAIAELPYHAKDIAAGEVIVHEGDRPQSCIVVLKGMLFRHKMVADGKRQILSFHIAGDLPDLQSLFLKTMDHGLQAAGDVRLMQVPHDALMRLIDSNLDIRHLLWRDSLLDAAIFREWVCNTGRRRAVVRVAHLLCEIFVRARAVGLTDGAAYSVPLTQTHLSDAVGLSMVHLNRSLQELRRQQLLQLTKTELTILDWPRLQSVADFDAGYLHLRHPVG